jgi:hypothetical protein
MTPQSILQFIRDNQNITGKELIEFLETPVVKQLKDRIEHRVLGKLHRKDGPAVEYKCGYKAWYLNGELHRIDGPAIETQYGDQHWYKHGKRHRTDGPAVEYANGDKSWWVNGIKTDSNFRPLK